MEMNIKPYGKNGFRCVLCDKKFSTENLMAVHFSRRHKEEAMGVLRALMLPTQPLATGTSNWHDQIGQKAWTGRCPRTWTKQL